MYIYIIYNKINIYIIYNICIFARGIPNTLFFYCIFPAFLKSAGRGSSPTQLRSYALQPWKRGWDWCPNVSHHPTIGDVNSNRYGCFGDVLNKFPIVGTSIPSPETSDVGQWIGSWEPWNRFQLKNYDLHGTQFPAKDSGETFCSGRNQSVEFVLLYPSTNQKSFKMMIQKYVSTLNISTINIHKS